MSLYLKYRPQRISDLDLDSVREVLDKMVEGGKIPQALLLAGPRGTGKTSAARILAKVVNCEENSRKVKEPCNKCDQCVSITNGSNIDVIEIDAASHRGIDDVRALIESVKLAPARARNKVYIIDEAHMLTLEASNALLKTLEEPPPSTYFILATTEPEKLIPTIRSRATIVSFKKASKREIVLSLQKKAKAEGKKIDRKILELIALRSDGSFRDAVKILEEIINESVELSLEKVTEYLDKSVFFDESLLIKKLVERDSSFVLDSIKKLSESGMSAETLVDKLLLFVRDEILTLAGLKAGKSDFDRETLLALAEDLLDVKRGLRDISGFEFLPLEIFVIRYCEKGSSNGGNNHVREKVEVKGDDSNQEETADSAPLRNGESLIGSANLSNEVWKNILSRVGSVDISVEALLRAAKPLRLDSGLLELGVYYSFHKGKLEEIKHRQLLEKVCSDVFGHNVKVICSLIKPPETKRNVCDVILEEKQGDDIIEVAKKIFES